MLEFCGMRSTPFLPSLPCPLSPGIVAPDRILSMGQIGLNCVLKLNWIVWNGTVFGHWNCILMLNWIVWNISFSMYKNGFGIYNLLCWCAMKPNQIKSLSLSLFLLHTHTHTHTLFLIRFSFFFAFLFIVFFFFPLGDVANVMNHGIIVSEFEFKSRY